MLDAAATETETALLAAITRAPDDDAPRLIYADWLQQRGDPRGEWIAVQCALARAPGAPGLLARQTKLARQHEERWLAELGLLPGEGMFSRGFVERVELPGVRAGALERLLASPVRDIVVRVGFHGNDAEIEQLTGALARALPPAFRSLHIDRHAHWAFLHQDRLELAGDTLRVEIDTPGGPRPVLAVLAALLARAPAVSTLELGFWARGRIEIDDVIAVLRDSEAMRRVDICFHDHFGRDWMHWIRSTRIAELAARYPALHRLSLPMGELRLDALDHATLRELELHWLGMTPSSLGDPDGHGPPPRGSGLEFLPRSRLPSLERLAIDFQFDRYVPWTTTDLIALCEAQLPSLERLELRYALDPDELCRHLVAAPFAAQLRELDLTGTAVGEAGARLLLDHRDAFPRLQRLRWLPPLGLADPLWQALSRAYPIERVR